MLIKCGGIITHDVGKRRLGIIIILVVMIMTLCPQTSYAAPQAVISFDNTSEVTVGDTFSVPLRISDNPGLAAISITILHDDNLTLLSASTSNTLLSGAEYIACDFQKNKNFTCLSSKNISQDGVFLYLQFRAERVGTRSYSARIVNDNAMNCLDIDYNPVQIVFGNGNVTVVEKSIPNPNPNPGPNPTPPPSPSPGGNSGNAGNNNSGQTGNTGGSVNRNSAISGSTGRTTGQTLPASATPTTGTESEESSDEATISTNQTPRSSADNSKNIENKSTPLASAEKNVFVSLWWLWLIIAILIVALLLFFVIIRRKRKTSESEKTDLFI